LVCGILEVYFQQQHLEYQEEVMADVIEAIDEIPVSQTRWFRVSLYLISFLQIIEKVDLSTLIK